MDPITVTLVAKDYGHLAPLAVGDVRAEGLDLRVDRDTRRAIDRTLRDPEVMLGESSISRHVARLAAGDRTWVGIPVFLMRGFRHRCFFVRADSPLAGFHDLVGKRIGTDNWMASGNTWSRAAMREQGVEPSQMRWVCGPVDGPPQDRPQGNLPGNASMAPADRNLLDMLLSGDLDALMCPDPPRGFYTAGSPVRRLFPDFRAVEEAYFQRTRLWPGIHITVIRRTLFEQHPQVAPAIHDALEASRQAWLGSRLALHETPWLLDDLEASRAQMGAEWGANGIDANAAMVAAFCQESYAQGLIPEPVEPDALFAEYAEAAKQ
ncbi:hypothetical protein RB614_35980 [Phytohabitans sp. ZYX-F-186]|uniref:4,5-dihydroxyphthalate decarboxylase n=1 Tax=Phytohabitans maris TaxID=3071409 RepID=A0ABU0ZSA7_9ACTN|nr:hypothetical protein [Phytohabitans sp. ZYX-F-186]MDQ7909911.1 hypothetical protein [Phytohabitans sp. ZYX-F-186]